MTSRPLETAPDRPDVPDNSRCVRCGAGFHCGATAGEAACWCMALPALDPLPVGPTTDPRRCLCPQCLRALLAADRGGSS